MPIKIQEYVKINKSGVKYRDKIEEVYCSGCPTQQQSPQTPCRQNKGRRWGGACACFSGF